jgi:hypothetical protein
MRFFQQESYSLLNQIWLKTITKVSHHLETTNMTPNEGFWNWFIQHEAELFGFEADRERVFDLLQTELGKIDPSVTFEIGPPTEMRREFVISADGIKSAFPAVSALVHAAPILARWKVTAFRPRRLLINQMDFKGKCVHPKDVQFTLLDNGEIAGLYLFIPGFREDEADLKAIGYLLLDEALGEYDVESRLGLIKMFSPDVQTEGERYPLADLPVLFDQWVSRPEGRSARPS